MTVREDLLRLLRRSVEFYFDPLWHWWFWALVVSGILFLWMCGGK